MNREAADHVPLTERLTHAEQKTIADQYLEMKRLEKSLESKLPLTDTARTRLEARRTEILANWERQGVLSMADAANVYDKLGEVTPIRKKVDVRKAASGVDDEVDAAFERIQQVG